MALNPPLPQPLNKWERFLIKAHAFDAPGIENLYAYVSTADSLSSVIWRKVVMRFSRTTPAGTTEDHAQIGLSIVRITSGQIDPTWTAVEYGSAETHLTEWWQRQRAQMDDTHTLVDYRWYQQAFSPDLPLNEHVNTPPPTGEKQWDRYARSGPPLRVTAVGQAGTETTGALLPYQNAISVTFKTPAPKHWGRVYMPGLTGGAMGLNGRYSASVPPFHANSFAELFDDLMGSGLWPVIPCTQVDGHFRLALNAPTGIQCDDIPDVVRRRRPRQATLRSAGVPTP